MLFIILLVLNFNHRRGNNDRINEALMDYFKIASPDWYLKIEKDDNKTNITYKYSIKAQGSKNPIEKTERELTLFYDGYIRQRSLIDLQHEKDDKNEIIEKPEEEFIYILNKYVNPKENKTAEKRYEVKQSINKDGKVDKSDIRILGCVIRCSKDKVIWH